MMRQLEDFSLDKTPLVDKLNGLCARCGNHSQFDLLYCAEGETRGYKILGLGNPTPIAVEKFAIFKCQCCGKLISIIQKDTEQSFSGMRSAKWEVTAILPFGPEIDIQTPTTVPIKAKEALSEAIVCIRTGCLSAAAIMTRRALEAVTGDQEKKHNISPGRNLGIRLETLKANGVMDARTHKLSHGIRWLGNDAAHSEDSSISKDDVILSMKFLFKLIDYCYQDEEDISSAGMRFR